MELNKVHLGDCLDLMREIDAMSVDAVIMDPPYILQSGSNGNVGGKIGTWGDMMNAVLFFKTVYQEAWRTIKPNGSMWSFCNWRSLPVVQKALMDSRIPLTSVIVWDKQWIGPAGPAQLRPTYELITLCAKGEFKIEDRSMSDVWREKWLAGVMGKFHPAEKPVDLIKKIMKVASLVEGQTVLDPFSGSGTVAVAAKSMKLNFIGIEQDEGFFEISQRRIAESTTQESFDLNFTQTEAPHDRQ